MPFDDQFAAIVREKIQRAKANWNARWLLTRIASIVQKTEQHRVIARIEQSREWIGTVTAAHASIEPFRLDDPSTERELIEVNEQIVLGTGTGRGSCAESTSRSNVRLRQKENTWYTRVDDQRGFREMLDEPWLPANDERLLRSVVNERVGQIVREIVTLLRRDHLWSSSPFRRAETHVDDEFPSLDMSFFPLDFQSEFDELHLLVVLNFTQIHVEE